MFGDYRVFKRVKEVPGTILLNDEQLRKLQECVIGIVKDIFDICQENGINVMLYAGSALGAIRHQGIIPWDDDVDICIPRKDYDQLLPLFEKKYADKYWIHTPERTSDYGSILTKIRLKGTVVKQFDDFENEECGAYVDVYVLALRKAHGAIACILKGLLACKRMVRDGKYMLPMLQEDHDAAQSIISRMRVGKLLSFISLDRLTRLTNAWTQLCKNSNTNYVFIPADIIHINGSEWERKIFGKGRPCKFGNDVWSIPERVEDYLGRVFGDYMSIPSPDKRESHCYVELKI